jgi:hypothetical protein
LAGDKLTRHSRKQKLSVFTLIIVSGLLIYADGIVLGIFSTLGAQDIVAYGTTVLAVVLTFLILAVNYKDAPKGKFSDTERVQGTEVSKESNKTTKDMGATVKVQHAQLKQSSIVQSSRSFKNQPKAISEEVQEKVKHVCPACRKELTLPSYLADYILDFGPPKNSNQFISCHYCNTTIRLKQKGTTMNF